VDAGTASFTYNGQTIVDLAAADYQGNAPDMGALESPYSGGSNNELPVAVAVADPTSGSAPLVVQFDGTGSSDPDGTIATYNWTFGDGSSATGATPSHTYESAGTYTAQLTVADDLGATSNDSVTVTVSEATQALHVEALSATRVKERKWERGQVTVLIADGAGQPVAGALVTVAYSGPTTGQVSGPTGADGTVVLLTDRAWKDKANWCFAVAGVAQDGWTYDAGANVATTICESQ
jgi:PKD repeat protein